MYAQTLYIHITISALKILFKTPILLYICLLKGGPIGATFIYLVFRFLKLRI